MSFHDLPEIIFILLQSFLSCDDYHYLLNSSKRLFQHVKRKTIYFHLTKEKSQEYLTDESFQSVLLSKVENGWNQIGVYYDERSSPAMRLDLPIHKVTSLDSELPSTLWGCFASISAIFPRSTTSFPFLSLRNVKELNIRLHPSASFTLNIFSRLLKLTLTSFNGDDITPLQHIPDLTLRTCPNIRNFSSLGSQKRLQIYDCKGLVDVRNFNNIRKLEIIACENLGEVSPLHRISDLILARCPKLNDISGLGGHHRFKLSHHFSRNLVGYDSLLFIPHVALISCNIRDLSVLRYAKSVHLSACHKITNVSALECVRDVKIDGMATVEGFQSLGNVSKLTLLYRGRKEIINDEVISSWKNVFRLQLEFSPCSQPNISNLSIFSKNTKHLTLGRDERFADFINEGQGCYLNHLTSLTLQFLNRLERVEGLGDIPTLRLMGCDGIISVKGLGRNHCVELVECAQLEDVSSLSTVPVVRIKSCPRVDSSCLLFVPRLKICD